MENLATPAAVRRIMKAHGFHLKKSLGQNFLVDSNILTKIVRAAGIEPGDFVLEIGPGIGALTQALAEAGASVVAVEIDHHLIGVLRETLADYDWVRVVEGDALKLDLKALLPPNLPCQVVANLPYYITSPLIMRLFEEQLPLTSALVMIQREVAERIVAEPGSKDYGALSVNLAYYAEAELVFSVPRTVFFPPPNVDSCIVRLKRRPFPYPVADAETFSLLVRAAFGQRRKTLRKALRNAGLEVDKLLHLAEIDGNRRGETLSPAEFGQLSLAAEKLRQ